jgi:hypothetical protein
MMRLYGTKQAYVAEKGNLLEDRARETQKRSTRNPAIVTKMYETAKFLVIFLQSSNLKVYVHLQQHAYAQNVSIG